MLIRRFKGATLAEAVEKTRAECGADALLVETRKTRDGYVVVAARPPAPDAKPKTSGPSGPAWTRGFRPLAERGTEFGLSPAILTAIEKAMVGTKIHLGRAGDPALPRVAARILGALIKTEPMNLPDYKVTALVGPTGVGKTTTLAKLAASAVRDRDESVAIITIDTYRVAAVEQLRAFADMLDVPFEVAFTPRDLRRTIAMHASADRILIDTSGRSPFDQKAIAGLRGVLAPSEAACVLCLCAHARRNDALATLSAFSELDPHSVVLTKWDETLTPGEALSVAIEHGLPLTHVTIGQEVPEDIVLADAAALAANVFTPPQAAEAVP